MIENIKAQLAESIKVKSSFSDELLAEIEKATNECINCLKNGGKLLICGNGGSAADSQHFTAELVSKFRIERKGLAAISLNTNNSSLTAIANDYHFNQVFARQVEALGNQNDLLFAISTSGNSENILQALEKAATKNIYCIGLSGQLGGKMRELCDICLKVPSTDTPRTQEAHITIIHILCDLIEQAFYEV